MSYRDQVTAAFESALERFNASPPIRRLTGGEIEIAHYQWILRQIFHHARENPQIQALATVHFRGKQRDWVKPFFKHATSEIGHDQLALNDLAALGVTVETIPDEAPLPNTTALLALPFYLIQHKNPVAYLGYLYFLEFTPTSSGERYLEALAAMGVPDTAMSFLLDHARIDVAHNKLMEAYLEGLIADRSDADAVCAAIQATALLYENMLQGALERADRELAEQADGRASQLHGFAAVGAR